MPRPPHNLWRKRTEGKNKKEINAGRKMRKEGNGEIGVWALVILVMWEM